jgi:hypothetical protein
MNLHWRCIEGNKGTRTLAGGGSGPQNNLDFVCTGLTGQAECIVARHPASSSGLPGYSHTRRCASANRNNKNNFNFASHLSPQPSNLLPAGGVAASVMELREFLVNGRAESFGGVYLGGGGGEGTMGNLIIAPVIPSSPRVQSSP